LIKTLSEGRLTAEESRGKSGVMFFYSVDKTVLFKQLRSFEFRSLNAMLDNYISHIDNNPSSFLCRFLGCYSVYDQRSRSKQYYICLKAFFSMDIVDRVYDLKGSTYKREAKKTKMLKNIVLKDLDALKQGLKISLGRQLRTTLELQLKADVNFLKEHYIIDYSFIIGLLSLPADDKKNVKRSEVLQKVIFVGKKQHRNPIKTEEEWNQKLKEQVSKIQNSTGKKKSQGTPILQDKYHSIFYSKDEHGGIMARNMNGQIVPGAVVYFLGIIDFLQPYNISKKMETGVKGIVHDKKTISCVDPTFYCKRFLRFVLNFVE